MDIMYEFYPNNKIRGEVFYRGGGFLLKSQKEIDMLCMYSTDNFQIIGNIHDTPELLEE